MNLKIFEHNNQKIAELTSDKVEINSLQDSLDLMASADYQGAHRVIIYEHNVHPDFFDLETKLAGDILQKYSTYSMKLAIVGEFEKYQSNALNAFIIECNRGNHIFFVEDAENAGRMLTG